MTKTSCPKYKKSKNVLEILVSKPFQSTGSHRGIAGGIQIPGMYLQAHFPFPISPQELPESLLTS